MTVLTVFCFVFVCPYPGGRGEGVLNKFIYGGGGGVDPEVQPLTLVVTIFHEKGTLSDTFYSQMVRLSHTSFLELCTPFNCCKCIVI